ncbi:MAG: winged helix-turn-helix domain-containing protein [Candidatus Thorarchaeota archaeon]|nr:winged helix-turn-helix domain-containing protein [Candidatus Thorarchaeota archaeon]
MPEGLAVLKWDDELGPVVTAKTPKGLKVGLDPTTSMRVYGIATLGETEESQKPGFSSLAFNDFKLAVYYGGLNMHLKGLPSMVFLVLGTDEDPDVYKDALPEMATQIFLNAEGKQYAKMVPTLFKQISRYTQMTPEQRQAAVVSDPVRRAILQVLMKNGSVGASDLEQLIFEEVGKKIDVEMVLRPLVKMGIVTTGWVEGLASEIVLLTRAILVQRLIHTDTMKAIRGGKVPTEVAKQYSVEAKRFHRDYIARLRRDLNETIWHEAEELAQFMLDFDAYDIIQLLRKGPELQDDIAPILKMPESTVKKHLSRLEQSNIITMIKDDEKRTHVLLKCNPEVATVYPEWLIERTADLYNDEDVHTRQAIHYLEQLRKSHPSNVSSLKEVV